jgi:hypothetical protein
MKIRSAVLELCHEDRQTDRHGEANRRIFATFSCENAQKRAPPLQATTGWTVTLRNLCS